MKQVQTQLYMQHKLALQIWLTVCNLLVRLSSGWVTWPSRVTSVTSIPLAHRPSKGHRGLDVEDQRSIGQWPLLKFIYGLKVLG